MKNSSEKTVAAAQGVSKAASVAIEADKQGRVVTIVISVKGKAQRSLTLSKHQSRLRHEVEQLVESVLASPRPVASVRKLASRVLDAASAPTRTKEPNCTIGVTSSEYLLEELRTIAEERGEPIAVVAREMFDRGLSTFEKRLWNEPSASVLADFKSAYADFRSDNTKQWSLRPERRRYLKSVLLAREYGVSHSQLACWCIAVALATLVTA